MSFREPFNTWSTISVGPRWRSSQFSDQWPGLNSSSVELGEIYGWDMDGDMRIWILDSSEDHDRKTEEWHCENAWDSWRSNLRQTLNRGWISSKVHFSIEEIEKLSRNQFTLSPPRQIQQLPSPQTSQSLSFFALTSAASCSSANCLFLLVNSSSAEILIAFAVSFASFLAISAIASSFSA